MKTRVVAALCAPVVALQGAALAQSYAPGFVWDRSTDWQPGLVPNTSQGNPRPDGEGSAVWSYEWVQGGGFGTPNEWFTQPSTLGVWDDDWWGHGRGAWVQGDNTNPPIFRDRMTHNVHDSSAENIPLLRWVNPVGSTEVDVVGSLKVTWSGHEFFGVPVGVEVVIAHNDFSTGIASPILAEVLEKPDPFPSVGDAQTIPVDLRSIDLDEGDSLIFSLRGQSTVGGDGRWVIMEDNVQIVLIPSPGAAALLAMGGVIALRRRR